jgi:hypothetical protein
MSVQTIYRVEYELRASPAMEDITEKTEDLLTELHGLAIGSITCDSFDGNAAFHPQIRADFDSLDKASLCDASWMDAINRSGFVWEE